ncbi:probable serine/threonine-protein kinase tsuA [Tribolium castaneum]|uniref:probable serine/threonine-protein kinase tsuA n=1 Tax=Tribolium castaneum TaxID=7070 RepID=UPI0030FE47FA
MKLPLLCLFLALTLQSSLSTTIRHIEKRQICSNGGCNSCDGRSCNSCSDNVCCSTINCNQCVSRCANECSSVQCTNNCVKGCQSSCQNQPQSCNTQSCSSCVNRCSSQCSTNQCINSCANNCASCKSSNSNNNEDTSIIVESPQPSSVIVNNTNNNLVNLTTQVDIHNVVHNFNNITIPVYVNTTNINNINLSHSDETRSYTNGSSGRIEYYPIPQPYPQPIPQPIPIPAPEPYENNCCTVLHPRQCYSEQGVDRCFIRRHRECSSSCTSPVVTIEESEGAAQKCQFVRNWPYAYCGNYRRGNCNSCYNCGDGYNPSQCFQSSGCSDQCRRGAPPCIADKGGFRCY